jgi:hypothetical protein
MVNVKDKKSVSSIKPQNLSNYNKSVSLGKEMMKNTDVSKVEVSMKMYELFSSFHLLQEKSKMSLQPASTFSTDSSYALLS